jgi:hypothetical protein
MELVFFEGIKKYNSSSNHLYEDVPKMKIIPREIKSNMAMNTICILCIYKIIIIIIIIILCFCSSLLRIEN